MTEITITPTSTSTFIPNTPNTPNLDDRHENEDTLRMKIDKIRRTYQGKIDSGMRILEEQREERNQELIAKGLELKLIIEHHIEHYNKKTQKNTAQITAIFVIVVAYVAVKTLL